MSAEVFAILKNIQERLSNIESGMASFSPSSPATASGASEVPKSITAFDQYLVRNMDPFLAACKKLGGDALTGGKLLSDAWTELRSILVMAAACKEPSTTEFPALLAGLAAKTKALSDSIKRNEWEKHMKTLSEGVQSLNWVMVKPAPCDFITSYADGAEYWANNIRKEHRATSPDQIEFCNAFKTLMLGLVAYVKEYHTTGLSWNNKGIPVSAYSGSAAATPAAAATPSKPAAATAASSAAKPQGADLFAALNKGGNITSGLKTVTKDMQTWRAEYKGDAAAVVPTAPVAAAKVTPLSVGKGPPKFEFVNAGSKWLVENQTDKYGVIEVLITEMKETVYIYGCAGATINIKGKCKSIVVDGCKKTQVRVSERFPIVALSYTYRCDVTILSIIESHHNNDSTPILFQVLFDTAMASCEVINCQRMQIQCREKVAAVAIDKTDGIIVFLPTTSLGENSSSHLHHLLYLFAPPRSSQSWIALHLIEFFLHVTLSL